MFVTLKTIDVHVGKYSESMKRVLLLTGPPRVGKTTLLLRVANELRGKGFRFGGMISQEVRKNSVRVGFEIRDCISGEKGWLAHIQQRVGPRIGKYRVNLRDLNSIGVKAILNALKTADIVVIDEIGPMELLSKLFVSVVKKTLASKKPILGTIHYRVNDQFIHQIFSRNDVEIIYVTTKNREQILVPIAEKVLSLARHNLQQNMGIGGKARA